MYSDDPIWSDIMPLAQDDGGPNPLAAIAYKEEYSEAMSYLRAVMAKNEFSDRALGLTEHIIGMNPAHYTVWLYRTKIIFELHKGIRDEISWLNGVALKYQKNYQIWHHRLVMIDKLDDASGETAFISQMFKKDAKNYHVWSYRQWLVRRFDLWDTEMPEIEDLLRDDIRNNSAWNYRFFIVFGRERPLDGETVDRELEFSRKAIVQAPQNPSPWNYLRGVLRKVDLPLSSFKAFANEFASLDRQDDIRSSHALDLLADIYAEEQDGQKNAAKSLDLLAEKYDPIRAGFWNYKKGLLGITSPTA
ncbi:MAG: hypothetical protein M4579_006412 [Chaenotheca gracillima]|nr:MAG: hypothetical protein M4579_006412 [Chaenotheca gracillima]